MRKDEEMQKGDMMRDGSREAGGGIGVPSCVGNYSELALALRCWSARSATQQKETSQKLY
jgi:hypothetical protein